jgi:hypothetical protein
MLSHTLTVDGKAWRVYPSGFVTQYDHDEFGLLFVHDIGTSREVRVTRYSPTRSRSREASFAELSETDLQRLFKWSQPSETSPEAGYAQATES